MGARLSVVDDSDIRSQTGKRRVADVGQPNVSLEPFNYGSSLPPVWTQLVNFLTLPSAEHFQRNVPVDSSSQLLWSIDLHFAPRSERRIIASFAAHFPRTGMTPAPVNQHLSGGSIGVWRIDSRQRISCSLLPRLQSTCYPCCIGLHPSRLSVCFAGDQGLGLVDLSLPAVNGLHRVVSSGKLNMGEVVKSVAVSPSGARVLTLVRLSNSFHLRIVQLHSMSVVENELRLSRLIPCLRLGRTYTETGHCAWSWDGRRVGFATSTGHYGVLLLVRRSRQRADSCSDSGSGGSCLALEWCHRPAIGNAGSVSDTAALSSPRAFAFWPADPEEAVGQLPWEDELDDEEASEDGFRRPPSLRCRSIVALGNASGFLDIVGGFVSAGIDNHDAENASRDEKDQESLGGPDREQLAKYRRLLRVPMTKGEDSADGEDGGTEGEVDLPEVVQFSSSGRLLAVGCRSGLIRVYRFICQRQRGRNGGTSDGGSKSDEENSAATTGICVSLIQLQILDSNSTEAAATASVISLAFADTEEVLAAASSSGSVRLWRLPPHSQLDSVENAGDYTFSGSAVSTLAELCCRAVASRCRRGCVGRLPLPPSLLPTLCPNLPDRRRIVNRLLGNGDTADYLGEHDDTRIFGISFL